MRKKNQPGCKCCGPCATADPTVLGCSSSPLSGALVGITGPGGFSASCTTGANGKCSSPVALTGGTGLYSGTVTPAAGSNYQGGAFSLNVAGCAGTAFSPTVTLSPASGYSCTPNFCCPDLPGPPYATAVSWPTSIWLNDGISTLSLAGNGTSPAYYTFATRVASSANDFSVFSPPLQCSGTATNTTVTIYYAVLCQGFFFGVGYKWNVAIGYYPGRFEAASPCATNCFGGLAVQHDTSCGWAAGHSPTFNGTGMGPFPPSNPTGSYGVAGDIVASTNSCNPFAVAASGTIGDFSGNTQGWQFSQPLTNVYGGTDSLSIPVAIHF